MGCPISQTLVDVGRIHPRTSWEAPEPSYQLMQDEYLSKADAARSLQRPIFAM